jgi:hypothetical protein
VVVAVSAYRGQYWLPPIRWVGLAAFTLLTFQAVIAQFRTSWRSWSFWLWILGLLVGHTVLYVLTLRAIPDWRAYGFGIVAIAETAFLLYFLCWLGYPLSMARKVG